MRIADLIASRRNPSTIPPEPLTTAELAKQREALVCKMVEAISARNFTEARRYSYEEIRLRKALEWLQAANCSQQS